MLITATSPLLIPLVFALGGLGALLALWLIKTPRLAIGFLVFSLLAGQLIRFPLPGQGGGLLLSDLATIFVILTFILQFFINPPKTSSLDSLLLFLLTPFFIWSLFALIIQAPHLGFTNTAISFSYWLRLSFNLLLLPSLLFLFQDKNNQQGAWRILPPTIFLLVALGFIQLIFWSDLSPYVQLGWDPHQGRMVSTWLDPNFLGIALVIAIPLIVVTPHLSLLKKISLGLLSALALVATQSRSAYLSFVLAAILAFPLILFVNTKKLTRQRFSLLLNITIFSFICLSLGAALLGPRLISLASNDPTVQLRLTNLSGAWQIISQHPLTGVGYNAYQFAAKQAGLISDFQLHSRAGTDNSLLTIWATTGLVGLTLFLLPWLYLAHLLIHQVLVYQNNVALAALFGFIALLAHSLFINSFLYTHLLILLILSVSLSFSVLTNPSRH